MVTSPTLWLAVTACMVGLSVGLPTVLNKALKVLAESDLELKDFYRAMETHDFKKAGELYDKLMTNEQKLKTQAGNTALLKTKHRDLLVGRFMRLAEVQMKILVEKMSGIINSDRKREKTKGKPKKETEKTKENPKKAAEKTKENPKMATEKNKEEKEVGRGFRNGIFEPTLF